MWFYFFSDFLLCWYLKLRFVENTSWTKIPKNNHCAVSTVEAARGFPLSITVRWDMERWGCLLRLDATEGIFQSTNYTPQFNNKKVSAPDTDTEIGVWVRFQMPKPGFGRTLPRTLAPYFEIITCCLLLFITCLNFPLKIHFEILQGSQLQSGWWWKFGVHYYFNMQAGMWNLL